MSISADSSGGLYSGGLYGRCARYYDLLRADARTRIQRYFHNFIEGRTPGTALDLGCGTGHAARILTAAGWYVTGVDTSPAMIALAKLRSPTSAFLEGDLRAVSLERKFDLILILGDTLNHLMGPQDWPRTISRCASLLSDSGQLVFDMVTPFDMQQVWPKWVSVEESADVTLIVRGFYDDVRNVGVLQHSWFLQSDNDTYQRIDETLEHVAFALEDVKAWVMQAGLTIESLEDADGEDVNPENPPLRLVFSCKRSMSLF